MVWRATDPQGNEAAKVCLDIVPYVGASGFDLGCGPRKLFEHWLGIDNGRDTDLFGVPMKPDLMVPTCERLAMFANHCTDTVFSSHLLEHIEDYAGALREWWRLVRPGGHLILYLPHRDLYPRIGQPGSNPDHKHDFAPADIIDVMREEVAEGWDLVVNETRAERCEYSFLQVFRKLDGTERRESWSDPKPAKTAAIVRPGAYGDALWSSSLAAQLQADGYHVTLYTGPAGAEVMAADPHIDRIVTLRGHWFSDEDWVLYYLWESKKYTRFHNLIGVVEGRILPHPNDLPYHWPAAVRHAQMNRNYQEELHAVAQLPALFNQRFFPTEDETAWAREQRAKLFPGPLVVVAPTGSGGPKTWPHVQRFLELMDEAGVYTIVMGELRGEFNPPAKACILGKDLPIRRAMTLALQADVVVGTESAIVNAVASAPMLKVVLLSHSSPENLTKHWRNTMAVEPVGLACYPCHRLHKGFEFCAKDARTGWAACQSAASAEAIAAPVLEWIRESAQRAA